MLDWRLEVRISVLDSYPVLASLQTLLKCMITFPESPFNYTLKLFSSIICSSETGKREHARGN